MILQKIYSSPEWLFRAVSFKKGVNIIYANKTDKSSETNWSWKSLLLNLIDFCLLSDSWVKHISALRDNFIEASNHSICLEFIIEGKEYYIERPMKNSNKDILFWEKWHTLTSYNLNVKNTKDSELSLILCDLIFKRDGYEWIYSNEWLRRLLPFFIKKQENPATSMKFSDPIKYSGYMPEIMQYHLFFLNLDNTLLHKNFQLEDKKKNLKWAVSEIEVYLKTNFSVKNISDVDNKLDNLRIDKNSYEKNLDDLKLGSNYKDASNELNQITKKIKQHILDNHIDNHTLENYADNIDQKITIQTWRVDKLYAEVNSLLDWKIKKSLDSAKAFREKLGESRKNFLTEEINRLESITKKRDKEIIEMETEKNNLIKFLKAKDFVEDIGEAYEQLSNKKVDISKIESQTKLYKDLSTQLAELQTELSQIYTWINKYLNSIESEISNIRILLKNIYKKLYSWQVDEIDFVFSPKEKLKAKVDLKIEISKDLSFWKNRWRILLYDLMILIKSIQDWYKLPRFLIHDGIFDGVDKTQMINTCDYLTELSSWFDFQYIFTLNEDWDLDEDKFWNSDYWTSEWIEEKAIIILSSTDNLFHWEEW